MASSLIVEKARHRYRAEQDWSYAPVSWHSRSGTMTWIVGPSGIGKSSLLACCAGLLSISQGQISWQIEGQTLSDWPTWRERWLGYVPSEWHWLPHHTVLDHLLMSGWIAGRSRIESQADLAYLELDAEQASYPERLSRGQQQRLALLCALAKRPQWILLDEPTSHLDPLLSQRVGNLLSDYQKIGMGIILISHDRLWHTWADQRIVLEPGIQG